MLDSAWDGEWFVRYFDDKGEPIGSAKNEYGKIWLNGQSWVVLSGFASGTDKGRKAMDSVKNILQQIKALNFLGGYNGFVATKAALQLIRGAKKMAVSSFILIMAIIAETILGDGDQAFDYYQRINPATKNNSIDEYECEPYCYAQNILSNEHPNFGLAKLMAFRHINGHTKLQLNIFLESDLSILDFALSRVFRKAGKSFDVERTCRGSVYKISVKNTSGVSKGIKSIKLNGKPVDGVIIPYQKTGTTNIVEVEM